MPLTRRHALTATASAVLAWPLAHATPPAARGDLRRELQAAIDAFFHGWKSGDWSDFLERCDDALVFQFPVGEQRGRHLAPEGKRALAAWAMAHAAQGNRIDTSAVDLALFAEDWAVICDRGTGTIGGAPYTGLHALFMRANADGRLIEFREYFGELPN